MDQVDDYHGTKVADPYRWLEEDCRSSQRVEDWIVAQNEVTSAYLQALPQREKIRSRLTELWDYEKFGSPFKAGGRYYYMHNTGLQNQFVLFTMDSLDAEPRVLLDPNTWSEDGTVALQGMAFSDDGKHLAYGVQDGGSDWRKWQFMEIESGKHTRRRTEVGQVLRVSTGPRMARASFTVATTSRRRASSSRA